MRLGDGESRKLKAEMNSGGKAEKLKTEMGIFLTVPLQLKI